MSKTCPRCARRHVPPVYCPRDLLCRICINARRRASRQRTGRHRDYMRAYMRVYRAADPRREMATILRAIARRGGLFAAHPGCVSLDRLGDVPGHELPPDEALMRAEEARQPFARP